MKLKEKIIKLMKIIDDFIISIIRYCSIFVIKIIIVSSIVLLSSEIFGIKMYVRPIIMLNILLIILIGSYAIYHKNIEDYFRKYSCIVFGIIISYMHINGELQIIYNKFVCGKTLSIPQYFYKYIGEADKDRYYYYSFIVAVITIIVLTLISIIKRQIYKCLNEDKATKLNIENKETEDEKVLNFYKDDLLADRYSNYNSLVECVNSEGVYGIAINGRFGCGKSFLVDFFERNNLNKYEFIRIFSLSSNDENVEEYILKQLKKVIKKNGVFCSSVDDIIEYLNKLKFLNLFDEKPTNYEKYQDIINKIELIEKKIIFIVDDLDRIKSVEKIYKIFNVFEMIKCSNIKVIFLYDTEILAEKITTEDVVKKSVETGETVGKYTYFYSYIRKYIDREIIINEINDYKNCLKILFGKSDEIVDLLFNEKERIDKTLNNIVSYSKEFSDYCDLNPRILLMIHNEYNDLVVNNRYCNKELLIDCLLFKYYFEKAFLQFVRSNKDFTKFMEDKFNKPDNTNSKYILSDAVDIVLNPSFLTDIESKEVLKCIFLLTLLTFTNSCFHRDFMYVKLKDVDQCKIINETFNYLTNGK